MARALGSLGADSRERVRTHGLPHQRLPSGFERLMKSYIVVVRKGRDGTYPDQAAMKALPRPPS
ncbi:MAG: hypothetical protein F4Y47_03105 [Acidobacteriia bacterium]|nr:hypothetical protein [Terriglobia bacterium]